MREGAGASCTGAFPGHPFTSEGWVNKKTPCKEVKGMETPATAPNKSKKDLYDLLIDLGVSEYNAKLITEYIKGAPIKRLSIEPIKKVKRKNSKKLEIYNDTRYRHYDIAFSEVINKSFEPSYKLPLYIVSDKDKKLRCLLFIVIDIRCVLPEVIAQKLKSIYGWDVQPEFFVGVIKEVVTQSIDRWVETLGY
jgi:hypothetical protein